MAAVYKIYLKCNSTGCWTTYKTTRNTVSLKEQYFRQSSKEPCTLRRAQYQFFSSSEFILLFRCQRNKFTLQDYKLEQKGTRGFLQRRKHRVNFTEQDTRLLFILDQFLFSFKPQRCPLLAWLPFLFSLFSPRFCGHTD